jgi:alpha-L-fucosidase
LKNIASSGLQILIVLPLLFSMTALQAESNMDLSAITETPANKDTRMAWWRQARFGMFIHWGLYSVLAGRYENRPIDNGGEWIFEKAQIPLPYYETLTERFNPAAFDADQWVRMAKDAGMRYIVITSKHHDGFCLWDSTAGDYTVMRCMPFKRDILAELAKACKKHKVRLCFYYSIMDWHHPDYLPRRAWDNRPVENADFERYVDYMKAQLKELIIRYDPAVLWFDGDWENIWTYEYGRDLYQYLHAINPDLIINNRIDKGRKGPGKDGTSEPSKYSGDFDTPEQEIPEAGLTYDWETCMTMNDTWGYKSDDKNWKTADTLIRQLADTASKGGNYLLNVGPKADGTFPEESIKLLSKMGAWMRINSESIYRTTASPIGRPEWGRCTQKADGRCTRLYLHVFEWPKDGVLHIQGLNNKVHKAMLLDGKRPLQTAADESGITLTLPQTPPDSINSVVVLSIFGKPQTSATAVP